VLLASVGARAEDIDILEFLNDLGGKAISVIIDMNEGLKPGLFIDGSRVITKQEIVYLDDRSVSLTSYICSRDQAADGAFAIDCAEGRSPGATNTVMIDVSAIDPARTDANPTARAVTHQGAVAITSPEDFVRYSTTEGGTKTAAALTFHCRDGADCVTFSDGERKEQSFVLYCEGEESCRNLIAQTTQLVAAMNEAGKPDSPSPAEPVAVVLKRVQDTTNAMIWIKGPSILVSTRLSLEADGTVTMTRRMCRTKKEPVPILAATLCAEAPDRGFEISEFIDFRGSDVAGARMEPVTAFDPKELVFRKEGGREISIQCPAICSEDEDGFDATDWITGLYCAGEDACRSLIADLKLLAVAEPGATSPSTQKPQ